MSDPLTDLAYANLLGVFNERDDAARAKAAEQTYAEDVVFHDPDSTVTGRAAVDAKAKALLESSPGFAFRPAGPVRISHDLVMLPWQFGPEGADPVVSGLDVSLVADGRITVLYTLLDGPPPTQA
ncbi:nuclear transport factor 2 family protein [Symbioplanes lichenis]|uniref:nuclear transport factor 2 family protein n=1 Tax=Symbioplanes lichenis TaxID=1629072 RepID=UPI002738DA8A|nr:nuclear transport factor 2 family protein [Actinoplanes lichenis]